MNTIAQQITATDRRLLPHHAAMIPMTSASAADTVLFVAGEDRRERHNS